MKVRTAWAERLALVALLGVAAWLRWRYIQEISLFVDEFNTAWAAKNVLLRGLPIFPSGNFYAHGMLFTYLEAPFVAGTFNETLIRLPGLLASLLGIPVAYGVGRRILSPAAGTVTAAALALDPEAITWGGRARMYGLFQLLTLVTIYLWYRGLTEDSVRCRWLAMLALVATMFTHAEGLLLVPVLAMAMLLAWPWRRWFRWSVIAPWALAAAGALAVFLITTLGQPGHLETLQHTRPYLELDADLLGGLWAFAPAFLAWHRLPFALLAVAGMAWAARPPWSRQRRHKVALGPHLYLAIVLLGFAGLLLLLAGDTWQRERYVFVILPILYFAGGDLAGRLLRFRWWPMALAVLAAAWIGLTGSRQAYVQEWGYDLAFRYVQDRLQPDDLVLTQFPAASMLYLDRCDFFAIQREYEEYVMHKDGQPVDRWAGAPLLNTVAELEDLLRSGRTLWLVSDGWRFQTRYEPDFLLTVLDQFTPVFEERGVPVFRAQGYQQQRPPAVERTLRADFSDELTLTGYALATDHPRPGDALDITLNWRALDQAGPEYTAFVHLINQHGVGVGQTDGPVLGGFFQPALWPRDRDMPDPHQLLLAGNLPEGRYRLDAGLYLPGQASQPLPVEGGGDRVTLGFINVGELPAVADPATPVDMSFGPQPGAEGGSLTLRGYTLLESKLSLEVALVWFAVAPIERDYTVFVHLVAPDGEIVAQDDAPPGGAFYPTSFWQPGERVSDRHTLTLPAETRPGEYRLLVGVYFQPTLDRLPTAGQDNALLLTTVQVEGP